MIMLGQSMHVQVARACQARRQRLYTAAFNAWLSHQQRYILSSSMCVVMGVIPSNTVLERLALLAEASHDQQVAMLKLADVAQQCCLRRIIHAWR